MERDQGRADSADGADSGGRRVRRLRAAKDDASTLPTKSRDEQGIGWGDEPAERDEDWYRRERPPHHE